MMMRESIMSRAAASGGGGGGGGGGAGAGTDKVTNSSNTSNIEIPPHGAEPQQRSLDRLELDPAIKATKGGVDFVDAGKDARFSSDSKIVTKMVNPDDIHKTVLKKRKVEDIEAKEEEEVREETTEVEAGTKDTKFNDDTSDDDDDDEDDMDDDDDEEEGDEDDETGERGAKKNSNEVDGHDKDTDNIASNSTDGTLIIPQRYTKSGRKRSIPFPVRLMTVLSDPKFHRIIEWLPSGRSFVIHNPKLFATDILPSRFKSAKYSSFTRKLHRWGFVRHFRGGESGAFYHNDFQKGRLDLAEAMTCCQLQQKESVSKKARKVAKQKASSSTSTKVPSSNSKSGSSPHKSIMSNFRSVVGGSAVSNLSPQLPHQLLSRSGTSPTARLPNNLNAMLNTNPLSSLSSSGVPDMLNDFTSTRATSFMLSPNRRSGGSVRPFSIDALDAGIPQRTSNRLSMDAISGAKANSRMMMNAESLQQEIVKARLDAAIEEELARMEYSHLANDRLTAPSSYNELLFQQRQYLLQQQRNSNMNNNNMMLAAASSRFGTTNSDRLLGALSQQQRMDNSSSHQMMFPPSSSRSERLMGSLSSSLLGAGVGMASSRVPSSSSSVPATTSPGATESSGGAASTLAPILSQLSRAELERYAIAMATRNAAGNNSQQHQSQQRRLPSNFHGI